MQYKWGISLVAITVFAGALFAGPGGLFTNYSFESSITPWNLYPKDTTVAGTMSLDSVGAKFGKKCLKVQVTRVNDSAAVRASDFSWYLQLQDPSWVAKKGYQYTYTCWAKADSVGRQMQITAQGDSASEWTYVTGTPSTLDTAWQLFSLTHTTTANGAKKAHFFIYLGFSTGTYWFDSVALDSVPGTHAKNPMVFSNPLPTAQYSVQLMPECMRFVMGNSAARVNNVAVYSLEGRLISSYNVPASTKIFELPKPAAGSWVVGVNSNKKVIQVR
jgi:hypothetical protein